MSLHACIKMFCIKMCMQILPFISMYCYFSAYAWIIMHKHNMFPCVHLTMKSVDFFVIYIYSVLIVFLFFMESKGQIYFVLLHLTFDHLMVSKVQVEQKEHVKSSQGPTQDEARSLTNSTGNQHSHLWERQQINED